MKRTEESIFLSKQKDPLPKQIRTKTLRKLLELNWLMLLSSADFSHNGLYDNPGKCIEYIMKRLHVNRRTAYDYYTTLLYLDNNYNQVIHENMGKFGLY